MHSLIRCMCIGELFVLPDQLVRAVVLVGDGSRPLSDLGYIPVVVVGIGIGVVAPVLVRGQQRLEMVDFPNGVVKRTVPLTPLPLFFSGLKLPPRHVQSL